MSCDPDAALSMRGRPPGVPAMTPRMTVLLASLGLLVGAQPASGQLRDDEVRTVRFEGNTTFPEDSLARAIVTKETDCRSFVLTPFCWIGMDFALRRSQRDTVR